MEIIRPIVQEIFIPTNYTSSREIIKNCLKEVLEGSTLEPQAGVLDNTNMTKKQREQIIKEHMENFTTKYYESDRRWHSFLPDDSHPRKQRAIAKRKWEDLEKAIIIRQSLDYLVERGELSVNPYNEFKVNTSLFTPVVPKEPEYEVFSEKEEKDIKKMAMAEFIANPEHTAPLAVVLNFSLALRVGELLSLKWKDLKESYLHIRRMEQRQYTRDEEEN